MKNKIDFRERKDGEMAHRKEENKINELVSHFKNIKLPECVEARIQETYRMILESTEKRVKSSDIVK